jgi:hypothetical protein
VIGEKALAVLLGHLGEREMGGRNQGAIVEWACKRWLSPERYNEQLARGALQWCAGAVCSAFADAGSQVIHEVASLSCRTLFQNLQKRSMTFGLLDPQLAPQRGDVVFTDSDQDGRPGHVGIVESVGAFVDARGRSEPAPYVPGSILVVSGNSGPQADRVARSCVLDERIFGFARLLG